MISQKSSLNVFFRVFLAIIFTAQTTYAGTCLTYLTLNDPDLPSLPVATQLLQRSAVSAEAINSLVAESKAVLGNDFTAELNKMITKYGQEMELLLKSGAEDEIDQVNALILWNKLQLELVVQIERAKTKNNKIPLVTITAEEQDFIRNISLNQDNETQISQLTRLANSIGKKAVGVTAALTMLSFFIIGVNGVSKGINMFGAEHVDSFFGAASNPAVGLFSAILATAMLQSSSATTSIIVGLVASGTLPVESAIFMVMGANIGTSVTNSMVAVFGRLFGAIKGGESFRNAFHAATVHDVFNWLTVGVLLPLELGTGFLAKATAPLSQILASDESESFSSPLKVLIKSGVNGVKDIASFTVDKLGAVIPDSMESNIEGSIVLGLSAILLYGGIFGLSKILDGDGIKSKLKSLFLKVKNPFAAIGIGAGATAALQSSSLTTSMLVPLAAAGALTIDTVFLLTMGANIGTTTTGLLAATGAGAAALQIALVHVMFNLTGTGLFLPNFMRKIPIAISGKIAQWAEKRPLASALGVLAMFVGLPLAVIAGAPNKDIEQKIQQELQNGPTPIVEQIRQVEQVRPEEQIK